MFKRGFFTILLLAFSWQAVFAGTSGKITGHVTDVDTGEPLIGVNIILQGTSMGAATDQNGYYVILNVPPGLYNITASAIGYASHIVQGVRVEIDLTTPLDFQMKTEVLIGEEVVITADTRIIKQDVSASQRNISSDRIQNLPAVSVTEVLGLEAGITTGLSIRGSGSDQALFMVDGISMKDERTNSPMTSIPLSAVEEVSVQTGGFSAEYSNVRSGVVNVVTKEGSATHYSGMISINYSLPAQKYFGDLSPYHENAFWLRPYLDPAVCWTGTANGEPYEDTNANGQWDEGESFTDYNGDGELTVWDKFMGDQYPEFGGWIRASESTLNDDDPTNDLTPTAAQKLFRYQHRKQGDIVEPDYNVDAGFGGPVPLISRALGNLRFYASVKLNRNMYLYETNRDALSEHVGYLKITSDLAPNTKFSLMGRYGEILGTAAGYTSYFTTPWGLADAVDQVGHTLSWRLYMNDYWSRTSRLSTMISAKLTRVLSPNSYIELALEHNWRSYLTGPGNDRDTSKTQVVYGDYKVDESPEGFSTVPTYAVGDGMGMGGSMSAYRDSSRFSTTTFKAHLSSQVSPLHEIMTGFEMVYDFFDLRYGTINKALPEGNRWVGTSNDPYFKDNPPFSESPIRATLFFQDKIEARGFVARLGLTADYIDPNGEWYVLADPYDPDFLSGQDYSPEKEATFEKAPTAAHFYLSPRLGISHPITVNSKLYFNYGHYRQIPSAQDLFRVQRKGVKEYVLQYLGDPEVPLMKTISYELGYDHDLGGNFLLHLAAYYKDVSNQSRWVRYENLKEDSYNRLTNFNYEDIRGLEFDLSKIYGQWFTGYINYEYRVGTSGNFGLARQYQNPKDQRGHIRENPPEQSRPRPRPILKANISLHTPGDFAPSTFGGRILGGWLVSLVGSHRAGSWFTYNPGGVQGLKYNLQWRASNYADLKASKTFAFGGFRATFFLNIYNVFNFKNFSGVAFYDKFDYDRYLGSLHFPEDVAATFGSAQLSNIPGNDQPGDVREEGVEFVPMLTSRPEYLEFLSDREMYWYDSESGLYYYNEDGAWLEADQGQIQDLLDSRAYIDMPNQTYFTFLNPRDIHFGLRISMDLR